MLQLLRIPNLGSANERVIFVDWETKEGEEISSGDVIASVETDKAAFEMEAPGDIVVLRQLLSVGDEVPQGTAYAVVANPEDTVSSEAIDEILTSATQESNEEENEKSISPRKSTRPAETATESAILAVPMARRRAASLGLNLRDITPSGPQGTITIADVDKHAHNSQQSSQRDGHIDPEFLTQVKEDRDAFAALNSDLKITLYRRFGASIGAHCHLGEGSLILADQLVMEPGAALGKNVICEGKELRIGTNTYIGPRSTLRGTRIRLGTNAYFVRDVEVGGGGWRDPQSFIDIGADGFIGENVHLNSCRGITIGDEVTISRNAVIMTHSYAQSELEGYPTVFEAVTIEDNAQIGIGCTLFPGSHVEAGAVVLSNSSVVGRVTLGRMFGGVPAIDMKAACRPMPESSRKRVGIRLLSTFAELILGHGRSARLLNSNKTNDQVAWLFEEERQAAIIVLRFADGIWDIPKTDGLGSAEIILLQLDGMPESHGEYPNALTIDLRARQVEGQSGPCGESFREHLRKRGIRLRPGGWTYAGGWI